MTTEALERSLRALCKRSPFRPFLIEFTSGDRLWIPHPESVARVGDVFHFRGPDREQRLFDADGVAQLIDPAPPLKSS